jgi:hypothetical protein
MLWFSHINYVLQWLLMILQCDPSHHRPTPSALGTPSSATSSTPSARNTSFSPSSGSRGSISPLSSLGESFSQSPTQIFATSAIAHAGQGFSSMPTPNQNLSPSDFTLPDMPFMDPILSVSQTHNVDSELFQLADVEDVSLHDYLSQVSSNDSSYSSWSSYDNLFTLSYNDELPAMPNIITTWQDPSGDSRTSVTQQTHENILAQNYDPQSALCQTIVSSNALESESNINDWLHPSLDTENNARHQSMRRRPLSEQERDEVMRTRTSGACYLCKSQSVKVSCDTFVQTKFQVKRLTLTPSVRMGYHRPPLWETKPEYHTTPSKALEIPKLGVLWRTHNLNNHNFSGVVNIKIMFFIQILEISIWAWKLTRYSGILRAPGGLRFLAIQQVSRKWKALIRRYHLGRLQCILFYKL